jgi:hypothetical protein
MAGLVPAIHVATLPVLQYIVTTSSESWKNANKSFTFLKLYHMADLDKPGHDGVV